jgi:anti-anti-sigma regulatory factor
MPLKKAAPGQLSLTGPCTLDEVTELAQTLIPLADTGAPLQVNLAGVTDLDYAGLQILLALHKANRKTRFIQPSKVVEQVLERMDLKHLLIARGED